MMPGGRGNMLKDSYKKLENAFDADHVNFWSNLNRFNNLLVIVNISMFFLSGLVAKGYYYTFYSLIIFFTSYAIHIYKRQHHSSRKNAPL